MIIRFIIIVIYYLLIKQPISKPELNNKEYIRNEFNINKAEAILEIPLKKELFLTISIDEINLLSKPIYNINSRENNIEKNITLIYNSNNIIVLGAHSGVGSLAYFKNLHKLNVNSKITVTKNNKSEIFNVISVYETNKSGNIEIPKYSITKTLILTTCSENNDKQLIVLCKPIHNN